MPLIWAQGGVAIFTLAKQPSLIQRASGLWFGYLIDMAIERSGQCPTLLGFILYPYPAAAAAAEFLPPAAG